MSRDVSARLAMTKGRIGSKLLVAAEIISSNKLADLHETCDELTAIFVRIIKQSKAAPGSLLIPNWPMSAQRARRLNVPSPRTFKASTVICVALPSAPMVKVTPLRPIAFSPSVW